LKGGVRITGGALDYVEVLKWQEPEGRRLVWLNECGEIDTREIAGLILVRFAEIKARSPAIARRAAVTNNQDLPSALEVWKEHGVLYEPDLVWLGVFRDRDYKRNRREVDLPQWALGYVIVEEEDPIGSFGALGYARPEEMERFQGSFAWYCPLLVDEFGTVDPLADAFTD
jgi:hypothetical protein